jgi:hypothetical protein
MRIGTTTVVLKKPACLMITVLAFYRQEGLIPSVCDIRFYSYYVSHTRVIILSLLQNAFRAQSKTPTPSYTAGHNAYSDDQIRVCAVRRIQQRGRKQRLVSKPSMSSAASRKRRRRNAARIDGTGSGTRLCRLDRWEPSPIRTRAYGSCWAFSTTGSLGQATSFSRRVSSWRFPSKT